jgi:TonB-dependent starch-binding outer membrane protein SusC
MKKLSLILAMVLGTFGFAMAQKTLTGKVSDTKGEPLVGASVVVKGTTTGTVTDLDGKYALTVPTSATTLVITYVGFKTTEVAIGASNVVDIELSDNSSVLADFVVTGTGIATDKRKVAMDVQTLSAKQLPQTPTSSIDQALVGKVAGAQISSVNGTPGAKASILLRGINTINRGTSPMIMMDGVEMGATDINSIDPNSIERVEIVQGAAAASIYGAQGANGVIQIFSKKGKSGQLNIDFSTSYVNSSYLNIGGVEKARFHGFKTDASNNVIGSSGKPLVLNPELGLYEENLIWASTDPTVQINKPYDKNLQYVDHFKMFLQDATTTNNSLSISGGKDKFDFSISAGHNTQGSNFVNNGDFKRSNLTSNIGVELAKGLTLRSITQLAYTNRTINDEGGNSTIFALFNTRPFVDYSAKLADGNYPAFLGGAQGVNGTNPFFINQYSSQNQKTIDIIQGLNLTYSPIKYLELAAKYGINYQNQDFQSIYQNQSENVNVQETGYWWYSRNDGAPTGELLNNLYRTTFQNLLTSATLRFDFKEDFKINVPIKSSTQVAYDYRNKQFRRYRAQGIELPTYSPFTIAQAASQQIRDDYSEPFVTFGALVNQHFDFGEVAGVSAGIRSDYSSAFGEGSKPFTFPRGDAYFRVSALDFWQNGNLGKILPEVKLRAAYGEAGIQPKPFDRYVTLSTKTVGSTNAFYFPAKQSNPALNVEVSKELEFGADISIAASKTDWFSSIIFSPTYWKRSTENAIWDVDAAPSAGIATIKDNSFSLGSNGFQFSLKAAIANKKDFTWDFTANFGKQTSEITAIRGPEVVLVTAAGSTGYVLAPGKKIGQLFGYVGLKSLDQKDEFGEFMLPQDQASKYEVASNGWVVNKATKAPYFSANQYSFGDPNPDFNMSFINSISYKGFLKLDFQFDWVQGSNIYNQTKEWMYRDGIHSDYAKPFTIGGETGAWSAFYRGVYAERSRNGTKDYFYEDASFVRLRNLQLAIDLGQIFKVGFAKRLQVVVAGRNLWTKTKYTGMDPEVNSSNVYSGDGQGNSAWDRGTDHNTMPNLKSFQVGLNVGF